MRRWWAGIMAVVLAGVGGASFASTAPSAWSEDDSVPLIAGRVALVEGDADIWRVEEDGTSGQWDDAQLNDVVTAGTGLATGTHARLEVSVGPHAFRLAGTSSGGFSQLDYGNKVFNLERGVTSVRLARAEQDEHFVVVAGGVEIELTAPGRYRIDAIDGAPLRVSVFQGRAVARYNGQAAAGEVGQALVLTQTNVSYAAATTSPFDDWGLARDQRMMATPAVVSPYMTGAEDLGQYGDWVSDASYGSLWVPRAVPVDWAPYRMGRWRWVAPWGWTWVDAAPWGFAPFHYGRWVTVGGRWCWWPGRYVARPVWAPALVGFVGNGASVTVGVGSPGPLVGWYPLAPWNPYRPAYRTRPTYVTVINQTIINRPPPGVPATVNHGAGSTWVPGPRFREPVPRVAVATRPADVQPMVPPPRPVARTVAYGDGPESAPHRRAPLPGAVPPRNAQQGRLPPARLVQGDSNYRVTPPPPLPGNDPAPLKQPPPIRRVEPAPTPPAQSPDKDIPPPRQRANITPNPVPGTGRPRQVPDPAYPAVYPPGSLPMPPRTPTAQPNNPAKPPAAAPAAPASGTRPQPAQPPGLRNSPPSSRGPHPAGPMSNQPTQIAPLPDAPRTAPPPRTVPPPPPARAQNDAPANGGAKQGDGNRGKPMDR